MQTKDKFIFLIKNELGYKDFEADVIVEDQIDTKWLWNAQIYEKNSVRKGYLRWKGIW